MSEIKVLAFDVFGTVVDWHGSIVREMAALDAGVDGADFARAWRAGYQPAMRAVMEQGIWRGLDELHREILDDIAPRFGLDLDEAQARELTEVWHRLDPWPEAVAAIARLRTRFIVTPLSNGGVALLTHMARRAGIEWDLILSAELFGAYKPDPRVYLGVGELLAVRPDEVLMVAAHHDDLDAAQRCGLQTAYIERPHEYGSDAPKDVSPQPNHPLHCRDLGALADHLDC